MAAEQMNPDAPAICHRPPAVAHRPPPAARWPLAVLFLFLFLVLSGCNASSATSVDEKFLKATIGGKEFNLELALDQAARFQGLSDRKEIAADGGMIFVYSQPQTMAFVMRKCYVPIDIIFVGAGGRIVKMHEMSVVPYDTPEESLVRYSSEWPAQFAIEIRGGTLKNLNLKEGQKIELPYETLGAKAK